jgi:hypothetical protein
MINVTGMVSMTPPTCEVATIWPEYDPAASATLGFTVAITGLGAAQKPHPLPVVTVNHEPPVEVEAATL